MLKRKSYCNKTQSVYECDRCKTQMNSIERKIIYVIEKDKPLRKRWDLCSSCYNALQRGIKKGIKH